MALIEIKMKVYRPRANYRNLKTMTETQREEQLKEQEQKEYEDERELATWLEDNYGILEIFNMSEEERHEIDNDWRESCREYAEMCFEDDYIEEEITLRVSEEELNSHESFSLVGIA